MHNRFASPSTSYGANSPELVPHLAAIVGSGELISRLYRDPAGNYTFDLRKCDTRLEPELIFTHEDLRAMVKLVQVLAFAIADDGHLPAKSNRSILSISNDLDTVTRRWDSV